MTTVALVSDTHGVVDPRVAELVEECDLCVHAGDVGGAAVLDALRPRQQLFAVRGNNDTPRQWPAAEHPRLETLPRRQAIALPGGELVVVHGDRVLPARDRHRKLRQRHAGARAVVYGHSHRLAVDQEATPWVLNPGASGRSRTFGGPSCLLLEATDAAWRVEVFRFPHR